MSWVRAIVPVLAKYVYPTALFVQTLSIYLTVLVALQRYACLCRPHRASVSCQRRQVRRCIVGVVVFAAVFTLPRFFEYETAQSETSSNDVQNDTITTTTNNVPVTKLDIEQTDFSKNRIYRIVYFNLRPIKQVHARAKTSY